MAKLRLMRRKGPMNCLPRVSVYAFTRVTRQDVEIDNADLLRNLPRYEGQRLVSQLTNEANEIREAISKEDAFKHRMRVRALARKREKQRVITVI
jgi:hypothetical protein